MLSRKNTGIGTAGHLTPLERAPFAWGGRGGCFYIKFPGITAADDLIGLDKGEKVSQPNPQTTHPSFLAHVPKPLQVSTSFVNCTVMSLGTHGQVRY